MALRTKTAIVFLAAQTIFGATVEHRHLRHSVHGDLQITDDGISFSETGKHAEHSRVWKYEQIQQLELSETTLRILTYEDHQEAFGRDREFLFDDLPKDFAKGAYPMWKDKLDQRFIAKIADGEVTTLIEFPAKSLGMTRGVAGTLSFGQDRIVFRAGKSGESRTWRFSDIDNIASAGPFDFSLVTWEHHGVWNAGTREFRFQLQRAMEEARFNELWRLLTQSRNVR